MPLIGSRPSNAKVFCIGVGNDVNRALLSQIAEDAGGLAAFISHADNFERQAKAFRRKLTQPAASNVKIDFAGLDVYDLEPEQLPNLYHGVPVRMYGRYRGGGEPAGCFARLGRSGLPGYGLSVAGRSASI